LFFCAVLGSAQANQLSVGVQSGLEVIGERQTVLALSNMVNDSKGAATQGGTFVPESREEGRDEGEGTAPGSDGSDGDLDAPANGSILGGESQNGRAGQPATTSARSDSSGSNPSGQPEGATIPEPASGRVAERARGTRAASRRPLHRVEVGNDLRGEAGGHDEAYTGVVRTASPARPAHVEPNRASSSASSSEAPGRPLGGENGIPSARPESGGSAASHVSAVLERMLDLALAGGILTILLQRRRLSEQAAQVAKIEGSLQDMRAKLERLAELQGAPNGSGR
jgi:hypothetical protein